MPERRCAEHGCTTFPDAAWSYCADHMAEQEARGAAWAAGVAAPGEAEIRSCVATMPEPLAPVEAVIGGVILYAASDPRIQAMASENDEQHFIEGCKSPWFEQLTGQALLAVRDAAVEQEGAESDA